ncbi:unnamed protein product [Boreogadus saida]
MLHATMLPPMRKRQRRTEGTEGPRYGVEVKFPDVRLYLVEKKMGATRRGFLAQLARAKGFLVEDVLSERVTHVVSEQNQAEELWQWLRRQALNNLPTLHVLDIGWFTDSMREGRPVTLEARHHIQPCFLCLQPCFLWVQPCFLCLQRCFLWVQQCFLCLKCCFLWRCFLLVQSCFLCLQCCFLCLQCCFLCLQCCFLSKEALQGGLCGPLQPKWQTNGEQEGGGALNGSLPISGGWRVWVVRCALHTVLGAWSRVDLSIIKVIGVTLNVWKLPPQSLTGVFTDVEFNAYSAKDEK